MENQPVATRVGNPKRNAIALVSMITGILSIFIGIISFFIPFGFIIGLLLGIGAIVTGIMGKVSEYRGFAITGIICGAVSTVIFGLFILLVLVIGSLFLGGLSAL